MYFDLAVLETTLTKKLTRFITSAFIASSFALASSVGMAQVPKGIIVHFFQPESVDPNLVLTYGNTDPLYSTAADMLNTGYPVNKGLEIHSGIKGSNGGILDVTQVQICFNYSGTVSAESLTYTTVYAPWNYDITHDGNLWCVNYFIPQTAAVYAPINNNFVPGFGNPMQQSYATVTVTTDDQLDPNNIQDLQEFVNQNPGNSISYTPSTALGLERGAAAVPEPGAFALFGAIIAGGGLTFLRRKTLKSKS